MNPQLTPLLHAVIPLLNEMEQGYALVGGLAVGVWAEPRFTRDLDFAIAVVSDDEAEVVARHLITSGYPVAVELDNHKTNRLATLRHLAPGSSIDDRGESHPLYVDLLFATCGIEREVVRDAVAAEILPGLKVPVAPLAHLIAMKCLSAGNQSRVQDRQDLVWLLGEANSAERALAAELVSLIDERGYNPGHDMQALLAESIKLAGEDEWGPDFVPRER